MIIFFMLVVLVVLVVVVVVVVTTMVISNSTFRYLGRDWNSSYGVAWSKGSTGSVNVKGGLTSYGLRTDPSANLITACADDFAAACRSIAQADNAAVGIVTSRHYGYTEALPAGWRLARQAAQRWNGQGAGLLLRSPSRTGRSSGYHGCQCNAEARHGACH